MKTDLIIIGSGPGGYEAAAYAARNRLHVVIIEQKLAGGTCLNHGCIPTKSLVHDAHNAMGLNDGAARFAAAIERKDAVVAGLRQNVESLMQHPQIIFVHGHATFADGHTIAVGNEYFEAQHIIIATGSTSKMLPMIAVDADGHPANPCVLTSDALLSVKTLPRSLCVIGAGVVGMEMASVFSAFGCEVSVVEYLKECLPTADTEIARRLRKAMEKQGIRFYLNSAVQQVENNKVVFTDTKKGTIASVEADCILVATGRKPCLEGMNLETVGIGLGPNGIVTNDNMQTNIGHIYAIGDVNGRQMLAHAATFQGFRAVNHILNKVDNIRLDIMPSAVFTHPEVGSVGPTEEQCKAEDISFTVQKAFYRANGRAQAMGQTDGFVKILFDSTDTVIACHALGADAAAIVQEVASLMNLGITRSRLADIIHIHPTLNEIIQDAARH